MIAGPSLARLKRVLAIDPTSKGFGFAVLEGPETLVDWGVKHARQAHHVSARIAELIERYEPDVMAVERVGASGCLRRERARRLIEGLHGLARHRHLRMRQISRQSVQRCFAAGEPATKRQIAAALTLRFPELRPHLPPERKPWMSEDERMAIFDAVGFAWKFFEPRRREVSALALFSEPAPFPRV